ncbi:MAG: hypothetical protein VX278_03355, partial [Myxococcota bacterium]|nr:hypothetical protein [Myxococcota bacterium]
YTPDDGGDFTISGTLDCGNDGENYTGDVDWFVIDFPCYSDARFVLDWSSSADLDFYVWGSDGDYLVGSSESENSGPIYEEAYTGGRLYLYVTCWDGANPSYDFTIDWTPFSNINSSEPSSEPSSEASSEPSSEPSSSPTSEPSSSPTSDPEDSEGEESNVEGDDVKIGGGCASAQGTASDYFLLSLLSLLMVRRTRKKSSP